MSAEGPGSARLWLVTLALAVTAVVLGLTGLAGYLPDTEYAAAGFWDRLYYTAQMFVMGPTPVEGPPYNVPLRLALFLAPFTTVLAVLQTISTVFRSQLLAWRLRHARGHAVVVGSGPEAFVLAQKLADEPTGRGWWRRATVLVGSDVAPDVARRHDVHVVPGDPLDAATLRAAGIPGAARVFAFSDELAANSARGMVNRLTDVKLVQGDLSEAWREGATEYATVAMRYTLTDVTVERSSGRVVETGDAQAVELWTFRRDRGGPWMLSAIQQGR